MKRITGILITLTALLFAAPVFAETAQPSEAVVTVDGNSVDFCAYNLYGSNYFMLRDVAVALIGTEKQFNVGWANNSISLTGKADYEQIGTEFSQNADSTADALFSTPDITLDGAEITLVGYNIKGSNYFKIRDIARIFDFNIGYEDGHISIDTTKQYVPEAPYESGEPNAGNELIGMAHEANFALFINEMPIVSYYTAVDTAYNEAQLARINENPRLNSVYVEAKNLENYGFDVTVYEDAIWLTRNKNKKFGILDGETINSAPTGVSEVYASDMKVYLDGADTRNIKINGEPYISASELIRYGDVTGVYGRNTLAHKLHKRINIDFLTKDLDEEINSMRTETIEDYTGDYREYVTYGNGYVRYASSNGHVQNHYVGQGEFVKDGNSMQRYVMNGSGVKRYYYQNVHINDGFSVMCGEFENGTLVDGVIMDSGEVYPKKIPGYRYDGAMVTGYHREFLTIDYGNNSSNFRFGYRAVREGTIENGEYVGYYREYDEDGKLIFEGQYADWVKNTN